jgi:dipeptidase E
MKRLFLASSGLDYIKKFVGREPSKIRMLFVPTAGNLDNDIWWIDKDRDVLGKMGFQITELDIANSNIDEMKAQLDVADIVYIAGGNTFYLLKQLKDSGFDKLLTGYVADGGLYAGASAGALVAGVDIEPVSTIDEPEKVNGLKSTKGLGFVNIVPIPHCDMTTRSEPIEAIKAKYADRFELVLLTDDDALVVDGNTWKMVRSERSALEHEWFDKNHDDLV